MERLCPFMFVFFKQKTAYEMRISDWSSDVCSSDLAPWPYGEQEAQKFLSMPLDPNQPRFLIFARTGGAPRLVGGCGISPSQGDDAGGELEMGYWIARPYWGLGFATEAGRQLLHIARAIDRKSTRLNSSH